MRRDLCLLVAVLLLCWTTAVSASPYTNASYDCVKGEFDCVEFCSDSIDVETTKSKCRDNSPYCEGDGFPATECECASSEKVYTNSAFYYCGERPEGVSPTWVLITFNAAFGIFLIMVVCVAIRRWRVEQAGRAMDERDGVQMGAVIPVDEVLPPPWERRAVGTAAGFLPSWQQADMSVIEIEEREPIPDAAADDDDNDESDDQEDKPLV